MTAARSPIEWLGIYLRGVAMGVAEVIPGVSGGTIAFITGIYSELLGTIARFGPASIVMLFREGPAEFARRHNFGFIMVLGLGMATSFVLLAGIITGLIETVPMLVWAFFFGLIAASVVDLVRDNVLSHLLTLGVVGLLLGLSVALIDMAPVEAGATWLVLGGMLAVCAWLLPGISGGYVLLLLGLYPIVIAGLAAADLAVLLPLAAGCILGLSLFARSLAYLMRRYYFPAMALFTGFMAGSLVSLWPWHLRAPLFDSARQFDLPVLPGTYADATGAAPMALACLASAIAGAVAIALLARLRTQREPFARRDDASR